MKAELIKMSGNYAHEYYAIKIIVPFKNAWGQSHFYLRSPLLGYPSSSTEEGEIREGLSPQVEQIYTEIVKAINLSHNNHKPVTIS